MVLIRTQRLADLQQSTVIDEIICEARINVEVRLDHARELSIR